MDLATGIGVYCPPGLILGLAQLFGRERPGPVNAFAARGRLGWRRLEQGAVFADASNIDGARQSFAQQSLVAVASVSHHMNEALRRNLRSQVDQASLGQGDQIGLLGGLAVGGAGVVVGPLARFGGGGGVDEINRHHPHRPGRTQGAGRRELEHPLGPGELNLEGRSQRIAPPGRALDAAAALGQERVVHPHHQGRLGAQGRFDRLPGGGE